MEVKNHFKAGELLQKKSPKELGLEYLTVQRIILNGEIVINSKEEEVCLVVINGRVQFIHEQKGGIASSKDMIYIPRRKKIKLFSEKGSEIMYYGAPSEMDSAISHIRFQDIDKNPETHVIAGSTHNNNKRDVWKYIDSDFRASRLMLGICESSPGGWTAWPPHEHAQKREEVYVYFNMGHGFGLQLLYDDLDNPYDIIIVKDGDLVSVPKGYHPNVACPAVKISYIYCMASKKSGDRNFMDLSVQKIFQENKFFE